MSDETLFYTEDFWHYSGRSISDVYSQVVSSRYLDRKMQGRKNLQVK